MSSSAEPAGTRQHARESLADRVEAIASSIDELETRVRTAELATGDEKTAKELRRAIEAVAKHDPKLEARLTDRVDVLADRLATLASTVSTTSAALARKDGEIAGLRRELEEGFRRAVALVRETGGPETSEIARLRHEIDAIQAARPAGGGDSRVDDLVPKVTLLAERVDTLGKTVATTASSLAARDGDIATLRQRLDASSGRIDDATTELKMLEALQEAVDATAAGLASREKEVGALRARIDEAYARVGTAITQLQGSIATLAAEVTTLQALPQATEDALRTHAAQLDTRVEELARRLQVLAAAVDSSTAVMIERQTEVAALTARVESVTAGVDDVAAKLEHALERLPNPEDVNAATEHRLGQLRDSITAVTTHVADLERAAAERADAATAAAMSATARLTELEERLSAFDSEREARAQELARAVSAWSQERDGIRDRLEALAAADAQAATAHEALAPRVDGLSAYLDELRDAVAAVTAQVTDVETAATARAEDATAAARGLAGRLDELRERLAGLETARQTGAEELTRAATAWAEEQEQVRHRLEALVAADAGFAEASGALAKEQDEISERLDALASAVAEATASRSPDDGTARMLHELAERLQEVEDDAAAAAAGAARTVTRWSAELETIETKLDELAAVRPESSSASAEASERLVAELAERVSALELDRRTVAAEVEQAGSAWRHDQASLAERLEQIAARLTALEQWERDPGAPSGELAVLRSTVDRLNLRLAAGEQELASLATTRDVGLRLDELTRRLESLEQAPLVLAGAPNSGPLPGDGRFRLEVRALELRMEHAEAAARENREAVLVQLERLAARIEWRFQRLEAELGPDQPQVIGGGGLVVPIRPTEGGDA